MPVSRGASFAGCLVAIAAAADLDAAATKEREEAAQVRRVEARRRAERPTPEGGTVGPTKLM